MNALIILTVLFVVVWLGVLSAFAFGKRLGLLPGWGELALSNEVVSKAEVEETMQRHVLVIRGPGMGDRDFKNMSWSASYSIQGVPFLIEAQGRDIQPNVVVLSADIRRRSDGETTGTGGSIEYRRKERYEAVAA